MHQMAIIGKFIAATEVSREQLDWGSMAWFSSPDASNARNLVVLEVRLSPGSGHNFHKHPRQEEVIYVIDGEVEQWLDREKRIIRHGDSVFIGADVVHASFNVSDRDAKLLAILGPCIGAAGYELVDVAGQEPWASLRQT
jgi:quercetin dioxygenase-like cupin family protein